VVTSRQAFLHDQQPARLLLLARTLHTQRIVNSFLAQARKPHGYPHNFGIWHQRPVTVYLSPEKRWEDGTAFLSFWNKLNET